MTKAAVKEGDETLFGEVQPPKGKNPGQKPTPEKPEPEPKTKASTAVAKIGRATAVVPTLVLTPTQLLQNSMERGLSPEVIEKFIALSERYEANEARKMFETAISAFKADLPEIKKTKKVSYDTRGGDKTEYWHEDLAEVLNVIGPKLAAVGLSVRFNTDSSSDQIKVTCIVAHAAGHRETNVLVGPRDTSGGKNAIQAVGSTVTYLQRYTLKAALGLAAADDDDAKSGDAGATNENDVGEKVQIKKLTIEQSETLVSLIKSSGVGLDRFLDKYKIEAVIDLDPKLYNAAVKACNNYAHEVKDAERTKS